MVDSHLPSRFNLDLTDELKANEFRMDQLASILKAVIHNGVPDDRYDGSGIKGVMVPLERGGFLHEIGAMYDLTFEMDVDQSTLYVYAIPVPAMPAVQVEKREGRFTNVQDVTAIRPIRGASTDRSSGVREPDGYRTHLESLDEGGTA